MKLLFGVVAAASAEWKSEGFDFSKISIPVKQEVQDKLRANQFEFVGNHWTDFSNNYGGCDVTLKDNEVSGPSPKNRYQPLAPEEECFTEKCMAPLRSNRRYKVCTLPDHPKVIQGASNYVTKLMATGTGQAKVNKDGKMKRFYDYLAVQVLTNEKLKEAAKAKGLLDADNKFNVADFEDADKYQDIYDIMMEVNYNAIGSNKGLMPARGWPEQVTDADARECSDRLINHIKTEAKSKEGETWDRNDPVADAFQLSEGLDSVSWNNDTLTTLYKDGQKESYCEFDEDLGIWHKCQNQEYHSVNPRCDPRFWYFAEEILRHPMNIDKFK